MLKKVFWEKALSGEDIFLYTLQNKNGMRVEISNFGATITGLYVPDKTGKIEDVVMSYEKLSDYYKNWHNIGCCIGPNVNRISDACFSIDGNVYHLEKGRDGHNLHSHFTLGYQKRVWLEEEFSDGKLTLFCECAHGEMGFPGNKINHISFILTEENELKLHYHVTTDKKTIINMTNHSYFNLSGNLSSSVKNHILWLNCSNYTPLGENGVPTGEIKNVSGTVMDFTTPKKIGEGLDGDNMEIAAAKGYDHNFCVNDWDKTQRKIGSLWDEKSGRYMEVYSDLPGVQVYTANYLGICMGKNKKIYKTHGAVCLETQYFPNHINEENFVSALFDENHPYDSTTVYKFSVKQ